MVMVRKSFGRTAVALGAMLLLAGPVAAQKKPDPGAEAQRDAKAAADAKLDRKSVV